MTKYVTSISRRECNKCASYKIAWSDAEDANHLCLSCLKMTGVE